MIDIIVPIYNSLSYLKECLESVKAYTNIPYRLILVEDCSTEKEIQPYVKEFASRNKEVVLILNEKNMGFVRSCNIGMSQSQTNDVLLLNTDTVVTPRWLEKMNQCAYSSQAIATVTALSNNAAICSVPNFGVDNELPTGITLNEYAELIEKRSLKKYYEIPTAIGFCMYIKRSILDLIGDLDAEHFGVGYGEENDFSRRVKEAGFINVVDDATFIYHKGSVSFSLEKRSERVEKNMKVMEELHPGYFDLMAEFLKSNPLSDIQSNVKFWLKNYDFGKKKILITKHYEPGIGGVGKHIEQIVNSSDEYSFYILSPDINGDLLLERYHSKEKTGKWSFKISEKQIVKTLSHREIEKWFEFIINYFEIDLVHFQHLLGLPLSLIDVAAQNKVETIFSIHDFFILSASPLLQKSSNSTEFYTPDEIISDLKDKNADKSVQSIRFQYLKKLLNKVSVIIAPSHYMKKVLEPMINKEIKLIEHGTALQKSKVEIKPGEGKINVAFLGVGSPLKGIQDFAQLAMDKSLSNNFNWKLIGPIYNYGDYVKQAGYGEGLKNIKIIGEYNYGNLQKIFSDEEISLILVPSIIAESYSLTLSEAIQSNIPIIVKDLGAQGDRVKRLNAGWTYNDSSELKSLLQKVSSDPSLLSSKSKQLKNVIIKAVQSMTKEYLKLYTELTSNSSKTNKALSDKETESNQLVFDHIVHNASTLAISPINEPPRSFVWKIKRTIRNTPIVGELIYKSYKKI